MEKFPTFLYEVLDVCERFPDRISVIDSDGRKNTYSDFLEIVERTSGYIKSTGIPSGSFVLVCLPNCMEYLAVEYGIWLCGCSIVPVSPFYPQARKDYIVNHCSAALVIDDDILAEIKDTGRMMVREVRADGIAALFYTSGSTGTPKGVIHTFESLSRIDHYDEVIETRPDDCFGLGAPMSFIAWIYTIPFLRAGACVRFIGREVMTDLRLLQEFYDSECVTCAIVTPSALRQLDFSNNRTIRYIITGTERVCNVAPQSSSYRLFNFYGMTETACLVNFCSVTEPYPNAPVGHHLSDVEMKIMDDGEICYRGPLAPGYYRDPEKSQALWQGGWFHTGDIGRLLPDGSLEYVNRKDWMVKINGQRVETGEISEVMKEMEGVSNAVAKGFSSEDGHQYVVGYYVADESVDEAGLRDFLSRKLAPYMIPAHFVRLEQLPLNDHGKIDIKSLQSPLAVAAIADRQIVLPENDCQKAICKAFSTVLGLGDISIDDDFFSLGGDSIRVMQLQLLCKEMKLSAAMVYRYRTPRLISGALMNPDNVSSTEAADDYPLSQTQTGIFVECMNRRGEIAYNNPFLYKLSPRIDLDRFAQACTAAFSAHPGLFAGIFTDDNGIPRQKATDAADYSLTVENMTDRQFAVERKALVRPFDILADRLFRARLIRTESASWFFVDFHHIVFDGTSNGILMSDIDDAYSGKAVKPEEYSSFDLAADESAQRKSPLLEECREWYLKNFTDIERTSLPSPDIFNDNILYGSLDTDLKISTEAFSKAADSLGVTENVLALASFGYMLGACTHATESAFATVYNGRKELRTSGTVSMMVKTLPVHCVWDSKTTVGEYLRNVKSRLTECMANDLFSFAELCSASAYDSSVLFTYQDELLERKTIAGYPCETEALVGNATGEPFAVQLYKKDGRLAVRTEYRSNMFSAEYVESLVSCFVSVLSSMMHIDKSASTSSLRLADEAQTAELLRMGRGHDMEFDADDTFVRLFRKQVAARPDSTALVDENGRTSYSELDRLSGILASRLIAEGVEAEDFVVLMLPRRREFPISYIACFKSGAAYVPVDCEYPIDRIQYMLDNSGAKVLLTTRKIFEDKRKEGEINVGKVIFVEEIGSDEDYAPDIDRSRPEGLAYMIYTSGTTGRPKGVMIEHRSLANMVHWLAGLESIVPSTRVAQHASFSFDGSLPDLMTPLCFGGELHIVSESLRKDLSGFYHYLSDNRIEGCTLTTQFGMTLMKSYNLKLRYLLLGGEKLSGRYDSDLCLINGYGPTEFTVCSSYFVVDPRNAPENIPIGKPVPNTTSAIVDPLGRLLPPGIPGELVLSGSQLARGYWQREDITAERFTDCGFIPGEKIYHTGDLAKWDGNGDLIYMGRIDSQVKLRGFRIELGEIESTMARYAGVRTPVAAVKEIGGVQHLCAYYCSDMAIDHDALRAFLAESLTDYMVPTAFIRMDAMPMTPNGKVDLRKLPIPEIKADEIVEPATGLEKSLFGLTSAALGNDAFGVTTNLISMGMTSLGAISLSLQIEKKLNLKISSSRMLESPDIRSWAGMLGDGGSADKEEVKAYPVQADYPLTDNQLGVYMDWERHKDSTQYNVPLVLHFKGIDSSRIVDAVKAFTDAHPYVKTRLKTIEGSVMQLRDDDGAIRIVTTELKSAPDRAFLQSRIRPFNLDGGRLCRFEVFTSGDETWLLSDVHHTIFDGGSESIFISDLLLFLNGGRIEPESFSAYDYSLHYSEWKNSDAFERAGEYFTDLLDKKLSVLIPSSGAEGEGVGSVRLTIDRGPISRCCRAAGVTENAFFLTATTQVLHKFTRENELALLTVSNGRSLRTLEHTAGMFVQTVPVVSRISSLSASESLKAMQNQIVETISRDKYPFTSIVEKTGIKANFIVAYQGELLGTDLAVEGKTIEFTGLSTDTAKSPLSLNITPAKDTVELLFEYDRAMFTGSDVRRFASAVAAFAENLAEADSGSSITSVPCVCSSEAEELIRVGSGKIMETDPSDTFVRQFRGIVSEYPDDTAVCDEYGSISYSELDRRSDILAGILLEKGVENDSFIGLMLPRTVDFVVSFVAAFKSGAAYVPMDSEYPIDRLQYMLEDSEAKVLVTTRSLFEQKRKEGEFNAPCILFIDEMDFGGASGHIDRSSADGLAYMIYTSGTTGKPKGVMIEHHSVVNLMAWMADGYGLTHGTRICHHASFSFDASVPDLMTTLSHGSVLYIMPEMLRKDPERIYRYLCDNKIEGMTASTQLGMMLMGSYSLPLRYLIVGGEKLTGKYDNGVRFVNGYGPTEFTVCSSYYTLDPKNTPDNIPIGKAVPNTVSAIVDGGGNLLPMGVTGELVLSGPQLARGYWHKEEITAQRFTPCPFLPGQKMYHTGDLACWNENGELMFQGRIDTQVKLRGFRIELGEIESAIASFEGIKSAVAIVKEINGVQHLCAYFTSSCEIDVPALKKYISASLASYMVPDALIQLDEMPLTPNGKIDSKALPSPGLAEKRVEEFEAPEGELETRIAEAFAFALGNAGQLGRNSSFFNLGGTSLLVMKAIVKLADAGLKVTYGDVFKYPTARTLAAFLEGVEAGAGASKPVSPAAVPEDNWLKGEDGFDYTSVRKSLASNKVDCIDSIRSLSVNPIGDVLLLGATGFLGIHILVELLKEPGRKIYCVIRPKKVLSCEGRLKSYLTYYFGSTYAELFGSRIFVVEGDMTDDSIMDKLASIKIDTVINCAANVKHFAAGDEIEKINLSGAERLVGYCMRTGCRLIHTSTHSVSGLTESGTAHTMPENELYFGQTLMTKYQQSKFAAERLILDACAKGLKAKIMRLGNLMPRYSDGEFQINVENNGFMARMRAYYLIGCIAASHLHSPVEFAPIDETASAILTLATTPDMFTVFHPFNNHSVFIDDVVATMRKCGLNIDIVDDAIFSERLHKCLENDRLNPYITSLVAYGSHNDYVVNPPSQDFTMTVLNDMGWRWSITGEDYLRESIDKMTSLDYFDKAFDE